MVPLASGSGGCRPRAAGPLLFRLMLRHRTMERALAEQNHSSHGSLPGSHHPLQGHASQDLMAPRGPTVYRLNGIVSGDQNFISGEPRLAHLSPGEVYRFCRGCPYLSCGRLPPTSRHPRAGSIKLTADIRSGCKHT